MPPRTGPPTLLVVIGAVVVVIAASVSGGIWGAKGFVGACLAGSILAGLVITRGE